MAVTDYSHKEGPPIDYNDRRRYYSEFYFEILPSGRESKRLSTRYIDFTPLNQCDVCGKVSTPKKINERHDCWFWFLEKNTFKERQKAISNNRGEYDPMNMLCTGCWNKVRKLIHLEKVRIKSDKEIDNLKLVIRDAKKRIKQ